MTRNTLEMNVTLRARLNVHEVGGSRNKLNPKGRLKRDNNLQCTSRLKEAAMLALNTNILSIRTTTRELSKCAMPNKEFAEQMIDELKRKICI